jgi:hypothetical protein
MNRCVSYALLQVCLVTALLSAAQPDHTVIYPRLICVVPVIGSGTAQDPYRPLFSPNPQAGAAQSGSSNQSSQIIAFQSLSTDDGKAAIVVFVARSYAAFVPILQDARVIRSFQRTQWAAGDLTRELQKYKKNFDLKMLRVGAL